MHDQRGEGQGAMGSRGVSRPMQQHHDEHGAPYSEARHRMLRAHHQQTLWIYWTLIMLGVWTAIAPFNFGYQRPNRSQIGPFGEASAGTRSSAESAAD